MYINEVRYDKDHFSPIYYSFLFMNLSHVYYYLNSMHSDINYFMREISNYYLIRVQHYIALNNGNNLSDHLVDPKYCRLL